MNTLFIVKFGFDKAICMRRMYKPESINVKGIDAKLTIKVNLYFLK